MWFRDSVKSPGYGRSVSSRSTVSLPIKTKLVLRWTILGFVVIVVIALRGRNWVEAPLLASSQQLQVARSNSRREHSSSLQQECTQQMCGSLPIKYPFGLSPECARNSFFQLECINDSIDNSAMREPGPWPYLNATGTFTNWNPETSSTIPGVNSMELSVNSFQILSFDAGSLIINTTQIKAFGCDSGCAGSGPQISNSTASIELPADGPYLLSSSNLFFTSGCNAEGWFSYQPFYDSADDFSEEYTCKAYCQNQHTINYCNDYGCCTLPIQLNTAIYLMVQGEPGYCSIVYPSTYTTWSPGTRGVGAYGVQVLWILHADTTQYPNCSALETMPGYACSSDLGAKCTVNTDLSGYFCDCEAGFEGDGYLNGTGCQDVDECKDPTLSKCSTDASCTNLVGTYNCSCPGNMEGDGFDNGTRCTSIDHGQSKNVALPAGLSTAGVLVFLMGSLLVWQTCRRKEKKSCGTIGPAPNSRREFLLEIQALGGANVCTIFTYDELAKATNDFAEDRVLGSGGFGTVFQGETEDGTKIAIKKAKHDGRGGRDDSKQFLNEVNILSQLNHRNLVKLLGCCLETQVPLLVFEFISNGSLHDYLASQKTGETKEDSQYLSPLDWDRRLQIAIDTAKGLKYLHSDTSPPIYHRDVKSANILLDDSYVAKVADFGLSKFVPLQATHVSTTIQGTPGYLDPEYFENSQVTDKSDVYSYGVVLLELLTLESPVDLSRQSGDQNLVVRCRRHLRLETLKDILDPSLSASINSDIQKATYAVTELAIKCVEMRRDDRPTMTEVLEELESIAKWTRKRGASGKVLGKLKSSPSTEFEMIESEPLSAGLSMKSQEIFHR